ncbi:MAG: GNAT family N-acetyltransferase [Planctomycetes bacterium]|nr:GNAT family N-acetyltransferase [Planctomycetota bacterium]MCB9905301.1 GNAT family N-acetyltransferase [Planctomycetota bacterium]
MDARLRTIGDREAARPLEARLDAAARESTEIHEGAPPPAGWAGRWLDAHLADPLSLLLVAETAEGAADLGVILVGGFDDPLGIERIPMILLLSVDPRHRHRGLASALVERAQEVLGGRGHSRLAARAPHNDDARISMGERWGFVREWELLERRS